MRWTVRRGPSKKACLYATFDIQGLARHELDASTSSSCLANPNPNPNHNPNPNPNPNPHPSPSPN